MAGWLSWIVPAALWLAFMASGYLYLGLAPLDPHNPARLPGPIARAAWSAVAATAMVMAPLYTGTLALFLASLAIGIILLPGLNDPQHQRRDENPSATGRWLASIFDKLAGGMLVKLLALVVGWATSLLVGPWWLLALAAIATFSIMGRVGALLARSGDPDEIRRDLVEALGGEIPATPETMSPRDLAVLATSPEREIFRNFQPRETAEKVALLRRKLIALRLYDREIMQRRVLWTVAALVVWTSLAASLLSAFPLGVDATNYAGALGLLLGALVGAVV